MRYVQDRPGDTLRCLTCQPIHLHLSGQQPHPVHRELQTRKLNHVERLQFPSQADRQVGVWRCAATRLRESAAHGWHEIPPEGRKSQRREARSVLGDRLRRRAAAYLSRLTAAGGSPVSSSLRLSSPRCWLVLRRLHVPRACVRHGAGGTVMIACSILRSAFYAPWQRQLGNFAAMSQRRHAFARHGGASDYTSTAPGWYPDPNGHFNRH